MMGPGHMVGAAAFTLGVGIVQIETARRTGLYAPLSVAEVTAAAVLAVPFSAGRWSPDADQTWLKRFGHRRGVHWWGWPVAVIVGLLAAGAPFPVLGPALGWLSHLWPCDWLYGKGGRSIPKGIPRWPWRNSPRHGFGLRVTARRSWLERWLIGTKRRHAVGEQVFTGVLFVVVLVELTVLSGAPGASF